MTAATSPQTAPPLCGWASFGEASPGGRRCPADETAGSSLKNLEWFAGVRHEDQRCWEPSSTPIGDKPMNPTQIGAGFRLNRKGRTAIIRRVDKGDARGVDVWNQDGIWKRNENAWLGRFVKPGFGESFGGISTFRDPGCRTPVDDPEHGWGAFGHSIGDLFAHSWRVVPKEQWNITWNFFFCLQRLYGACGQRVTGEQLRGSSHDLHLIFCSKSMFSCRSGGHACGLVIKPSWRRWRHKQDTGWKTFWRNWGNNHLMKLFCNQGPRLSFLFLLRVL